MGISALLMPGMFFVVRELYRFGYRRVSQSPGFITPLQFVLAFAILFDEPKPPAARAMLPPITQGVLTMRPNELRIFVLLLFLAGGNLCPGNCSAAEQTAWQWAGWGGGGFYWASAWHPTKEDVLYMGGDVAGMYKSEDKGLHWRLINRGLTDYEVYSLAVDPQHPETVYAGTPTGFCKSTDGGEHWQFLKATGKDAHGHHRRTPQERARPGGRSDQRCGALRRHAEGRALQEPRRRETWRKLDYLPAVQEKLKQPAAAPPAFSGRAAGA